MGGIIFWILKTKKERFIDFTNFLRTVCGERKRHNSTLLTYVTQRFIKCTQRMLQTASLTCSPLISSNCKPPPSNDRNRTLKKVLFMGMWWWFFAACRTCYLSDAHGYVHWMIFNGSVTISFIYGLNAKTN